MHEIEISTLLKSSNNSRLIVYYYWTVVIRFLFSSNNTHSVFISNLKFHALLCEILSLYISFFFGHKSFVKFCAVSTFQYFLFC